LRGVVLADTGPLYAAADPNDSSHARSLEEQEQLESENLQTAVSYATLQEAHVLVLRKLGNARVAVKVAPEPLRPKVVGERKR
jgi:predicted nucleic acid-binding protein